MQLGYQWKQSFIASGAADAISESTIRFYNTSELLAMGRFGDSGGIAVRIAVNVGCHFGSTRDTARGTQPSKILFDAIAMLAVGLARRCFRHCFRLWRIWRNLQRSADFGSNRKFFKKAWPVGRAGALYLYIISLSNGPKPTDCQRWVARGGTPVPFFWAALSRQPPIPANGFETKPGTIEAWQYFSGWSRKP